MLAVLSVVVVVVLLCFMVGLYQKNTNAMCKSKKRLDGKTAIITGGTAGMGLRIAIDFADRGARVIVACPYPEEGVSAVKTVHEKTGMDIIYKHLDLASLDSVRKFAADIMQCEDRLDILINNAGVGPVADFLTFDGLNFIMQVNYFGHFLLTLLLLPLLRKTGTPAEPSRIVCTASILHNVAEIDLENINRTDYWHKIKIYANSKLALLLFAKEFTCRFEGSHVVINTVDPGAVGTDIFHAIGTLRGRFLRFFFRNVYKTPWEGAQTAIHAALDRRAGKVSGKLFKNCKLIERKWDANSEKLGKRLWEESLRLVNMVDEEYSRCFRD